LHLAQRRFGEKCRGHGTPGRTPGVKPYNRNRLNQCSTQTGTVQIYDAYGEHSGRLTFSQVANGAALTRM
jgi:hypothetical protein